MHQPSRQSIFNPSFHPFNCGVCCIVVALATLVGHSPPALTQNVVSSAFTYQGRLAENGAPASGIYDLRFKIYDSGGGGDAVAGPVTNIAAAVNKGLFTVTLDFGGSAFDGGARWLEVGVRTNGATHDFNLLNPRQPLTATPYALYAGGANAAGLRGTVADSRLSANVARLDASEQVFAGSVQFNNPANTFTGAFTGNGAGMSNVPLASLVAPPAQRIVAWGRRISPFFGNVPDPFVEGIPVGLDNVVSAAVGWGHGLALKSDGTVVSWGEAGPASEPLSDVVAVAAGEHHSLALKSDGTVVAWGRYFEGQTDVPSNLSNAVAIAAGFFHNLALRSDGTVVAWGAMTYVPPDLSNVVAVAAGHYHSLALKRNGTVVGWGAEEWGAGVPENLSNVVAIAAGGYHSLASKSDGTVVAWGVTMDVPPDASNVVAVAAGIGYNVALRNDGTVVAWGSNYGGQTDVPAGLDHVVGIAAGFEHSLALVGLMTNPAPVVLRDRPNVFTHVNSFSNPANKFTGNGAGLTSLHASNLTIGTLDDARLSTNVAILHADQTFSGANAFSNANNSFVGTFAGTFAGSLAANGAGVTNLPLVSLVVPGSNAAVAAWGLNFWGQTTVPPDLSNAVAIAGGQYHSLALKNDGTVVTWGENDFGQTNVPANLNAVRAIAAGGDHSLALKGDGTVRGWGRNDFGQTTVPWNLRDVVAVAAGFDHSLALRNDGTVVAWGRNFLGQATVPPDLSNVVAIAAGGYFNLALRNDGTVLGWGDNDYGKATVPAGLNNVVAIAAGHSHSLALKSDGTVVAWGYDGAAPTSVTASLSNVLTVAAGGRHSIALKNDGAVVAWGNNGSSQASVPAGLRNVVAVAAGGSHSLALGRANVQAEVALLDQINTFQGVNSFNNPANSFAGTFMGNGAGLTGLNGTNFQDGTLTADKFSADLGVWSRTGTDLYHNTGKVGIGTNQPAQKLHVVGNILASGIIAGSSDWHAKTNFATVDAQAVLAKVAALPVQRWTFQTDPTTPHLGPMAQDFYAAFHLGLDDKHISMVDADGVALAAIQGLSQKLEEQLRVKDAEIEALKQRLNALEKLLHWAAEAHNGGEP